MPRQLRQADKVFRNKYGMPLAEFFDDTKYQLMHIEMFPYSIIHAECFGGEIDLPCNQRVTIGFFLWRFVDGESSIGRAWPSSTMPAGEELMAKSVDAQDQVRRCV
ncbi:MAG: hypothetical protein U0559_01480 [Anaerolineae bacterium]